MSFDENKAKVNLKLALNRMKIQKNKKVNEVKAARKNIAELLRTGKEEVARVKVEAVIRDDMLLQAFEIMELFMELLLSRISMIKMQGGCPFDLKEAVCTIIYAAPRLEAKELLEVRSQFITKYGKPFASEAMENKGHCVNEKVIHKLSVITPDNCCVVEYLESIAKENGVNWAPPVALTAPDNVGVFPPPPYIAAPIQPQPGYAPGQQPMMMMPGGSPYVMQPQPMAPQYPPAAHQQYAQPQQPYFPSPPGMMQQQPGMSSYAPPPQMQQQQPPPPGLGGLQFPSVPQAGGAPGGAGAVTPGEPGLDDLMARFNKLKSDNL